MVTLNYCPALQHLISFHTLLYCLIPLAHATCSRLICFHTDTLPCPPHCITTSLAFEGLSEPPHPHPAPTGPALFPLILLKSRQVIWGRRHRDKSWFMICSILHLNPQRERGNQAQKKCPPYLSTVTSAQNYRTHVHLLRRSYLEKNHNIGSKLHLYQTELKDCSPGKNSTKWWGTNRQ